MSEAGHWFESDPLWFKHAVFYEIHVRDALTDARYDWRLGRNYVRLEPGKSHVLVASR